jgi:hypothetical protein
MSYLHPPPGDAPVVVMKDVGGYVSEYAAQTAAYFGSGREVQLHECRSACTLSLSLPNVCVYPSSILKFHKAYNPITKVANEEVSQAMMAAYPEAVQARLVALTRDYKALTGSELIRMGIRECGTPRQPEIMLARARVKENPPENPVSNVFSSIVAVLAPAAPTGASPATGAQVKVQRVKAQPSQIPPLQVQLASQARPPAPVVSPPAVTPAAPEVKPLQVASSVATIPAPTSPPSVEKPGAAEMPTAILHAQQPTLSMSSESRPIRGSAPILLTTRFAPYPYRLAGKG